MLPLLSTTPIIFDVNINVLVADPNEAFATLIKEVLEESGSFLVVPTLNGEAALTAASLQPFDLAIIESEVDDIPLDEFIAGLRDHHPMMAVMLIPPFGEEAPAEAADLDLQGFLPKPFFIPEVRQRIEEVLNQPVGGVMPEPRELPEEAPKSTKPKATSRLSPELPPAPPWLQDVKKAAQYLTTLSLESAAEATLLTRGQQLFAYAGHFEREDAEELARIAADNWMRDSGAQGSLVRFVQLPNGEDYLLYSSLASANLVLSIVFQAETPLGMIRKQARRVTEALLTQPDLADTGPTEAIEPDSEELNEAEFGAGEIVDTDPVPATASDSQPIDLTPPAIIDVDFVEPELEPEAAIEPVMETEDTWPDYEDEHIAEASPPPVEESEPIKTPALEGAYGTHHGLYMLSYTFIWLPKFPHVQLKGDIVASLNQWIRHLALAYDWRVEDLDIQPEIVQLVIACAPSDPPEKIVQTMMQTTSENIMADFPRLAEEHPAGSFWAPGYYVVAPGRLLDAEEISHYIEHQRREQGIS